MKRDQFKFGSACQRLGSCRTLVRVAVESYMSRSAGGGHVSQMSPRLLAGRVDWPRGSGVGASDWLMGVAPGKCSVATVRYNDRDVMTAAATGSDVLRRSAVCSSLDRR